MLLSNMVTHKSSSKFNKSKHYPYNKFCIDGVTVYCENCGNTVLQGFLMRYLIQLLIIGREYLFRHFESFRFSF